jgi:uncharacterized protein
MRFVVDTHVLVSGLLSPHGPPGRILDGLVGGELVMVFDDRVLAEYVEVLARPRFGFKRRDIEELLDHLRTSGEHLVVSPVGADLPDPDDLPFLEVAVAGAVDALVTGNLRHYPERLVQGARVVDPSRFLAEWTRAGGEGRQ